jgi:hypothetical protein
MVRFHYFHPVDYNLIFLRTIQATINVIHPRRDRFRPICAGYECSTEPTGIRCSMSLVVLEIMNVRR